MKTAGNSGGMFFPGLAAAAAAAEPAESDSSGCLQLLLAMLILFLWPLVTGMLFGVCVGGPILLLTWLLHLILLYGVNPVLKLIRAIPWIGLPLACFLSLLITVALSVVIAGVLVVPMVLIIYHAMSGGRKL